MDGGVGCCGHLANLVEACVRYIAVVKIKPHYPANGSTNGSEAKMHELAIALAVIEQIEQRANDGLEGEIQSVHLRVGALTGVAPDALSFAWEVARGGTCVANAALAIERIPLRIVCERCGPRTVEGPPLPVCPDCGVPSRTILSGREFELVAFEIRSG
jgi:hydrogenase nickel incorporation protein HypA/HybF